MHTSSTPYTHLLRTYLAPQLGRVALLTILVLSSLALALWNPQLIRTFIDSAQERSGLDKLLGAATLFTALTIVQQIILLAATYISELIGWTATNRLRGDLALHCLKLDLAFHKTHTPGELIERVDGDVNQLARFFSQLVIQLSGNLLLFVGVLVLLWWEGWQIGLAVTLVAVSSIFVIEALRRRMTPRWERFRAAEADLYGFLEERLNGLEDIRAGGAVGYTMNRLYHFMRARWLAMRHVMRLNMWVISLPIWIFGFAYGAAHLASGPLFYSGALTLGSAYLIFYYVNLMEGPLWETLRQVEELQRALASINRIAALFAIQPQIRDGEGVSVPDAPLAVEFDHVSFHYEDDDESVITDLSFQLAPGQVLGLLGRTGSGKSTLSKLLFRFYDPTQGQIRLGDGNGCSFDLRQAQRADLRGRIGMVTQEVQIFNTSVRNNLTLFDATIADAQVLDVLEQVGMKPWLDGLADGLETKLGSSSLSAGEAQLLAFARVFLADPGLVILDEASSRLDPATEARVERALNALLHNRTAIIIAHRLATVQRADVILILEEGRVREYGPRQQLIADRTSRFSQLLQTGLEEVFA
ncbi:MAG: ABC transporter ATP-binding protein [Caldilineaceae bacterium]